MEADENKAVVVVVVVMVRIVVLVYGEQACRVSMMAEFFGR